MEIISHDENDVVRLYEASLRGSVAILNTLIQKDQLILCRVSLTSLSETPLHISAMLGHLDFVKSLLNQKPDLAVQLDSLKHSPLHLASAEGHTEIVKALLRVNKDVCLVRDQDGRIPLHLAAMRGRVEVMQELINARPESVGEVLDRGETVLHLCVKYNQLEALKLLVKSMKAHDLLNSRNEDGNTILHMAVMQKQLETIRFLFSIPEVKERANDLNGIGFTTLDIIENSPRDFKSLEIRDILMEAGVRRADLNNVTPLSPPKTQPTKSRFHRWIQYCIREKNQVNWSPQTLESLMVVATVIATMSFQAALSPPGGVWQENIEVNKFSCNPYAKLNFTVLEVEYCKAGTPVLAYSYPNEYIGFMVYNTLSFIGSLVVVLLIISGLPLKNKFCTWLLTVAMCTSVTFMAFTFVNVMYLVTPDYFLDLGTYVIVGTSLKTWIGFLGIVVAIHTLRIGYWLVKKLSQLIRKAESHNKTLVNKNCSCYCSCGV